jgi:hypothetical protein
MTYRLTARGRVFCEGTLKECQDALKGVNNMINAGFSTDFNLEEFLIYFDELTDNK